MAIISSKDLDQQMGQGVQLGAAPQRDHGGTGDGVMQGVIRRGSEHVVHSSHATNHGAPVYQPDEVAPTGYYGSATVISVSALEELDEVMDPASGRKGVPPVLIIKPVAAPAPAPVAPTAPAGPKPVTQADLLARMGLRR